jgi:hypothetical protein
MLRSSFGWRFWAKSPSPNRRRPARFRPIVEVLEDRAVPSVYHVTTSADSGAGSLRAAIAQANGNPAADNIIVFDDSLLGRTILLTGGELLITDDLRINGLGGSNLTVSGSHNSRVFEVGANAHVTLSGLGITSGDGMANPRDTSPFAGAGGGILNFGTLTMRESTLSGNSGLAGGGIFSSFGATVTLRDCTLSGNSGGIVGGGGLLSEGTLSVSDCTVSGNSGFDGGGIFNTFSGTMTIRDSTVSHNAGGDGGGIENDDSATIHDAILFGNSAGNLRGGGIANTGTLAVTDTILSGNSSVYGGGAIDNESFATLTISGCILYGNSVSGFVDPVVGRVGGLGGGIFNESFATLTVSSCILCRNSAGNSVFRGDGGGIANYQGTVMIRGSTLSGNSATGDGGGIFNTFGATMTVSDSTLSGNSAVGHGGGIFNNVSATLNVINDSTVCNNFAPLGSDLYNLGVLHKDTSSTICVIGP